MGPFFYPNMKNKIHMWGENIIKKFVSDYDDKMEATNDPRSKEFMKHLDALVKKYLFIKEGKKESIYIWLIITKMGSIEG